MSDKLMRKNLVELLEGGHAFVTLEQAVKDLKPENRNSRPAEGVHSVYELLEHMRLAQEDILRYTLDPEWVSPPWPEGYWPDPDKKLTDEKWDKTVTGFYSDLNELIALVNNEKIDLTTEIPHGEWRTYMREVMLAANHNAYHTGQIVDTRKSLGNWK